MLERALSEDIFKYVPSGRQNPKQNYNIAKYCKIIAIWLNIY